MRNDLPYQPVPWFTMTAVLDPPTDEVIDLDTNRWEVQTAIPLVIGKGREFLLVSHAEPDFGDLPTALGNPQDLLFQMFTAARQEMDLGGNLSSAVLFWQGQPAAGHVDGHQVGGLDAPQALRSLLASFVERSTGVSRLAQRALLEEQIEQFPIPTFGSPPNGWGNLVQIVTSGSCAVYSVDAAWSDQPVMACVGGGVAFAIWFLKPSIRVAQRSWTEKVGRWLRTDVKPEDYT